MKELNNEKWITIKEMIGNSYDVTVENNEQMIFSGVNKVVFYHWQSCCEDVRIEDIVGDIKDLINSPILQAEIFSREASESDNIENFNSGTWTFYKFATIKGSVTVRWLGESNGYYSESVSVSIDGKDVHEYSHHEWDY